MTVTNQPPPGRSRRTSTPPTRLPSTKERRPALAALAVLLIVGGAVLAGWLALRESHTDAYLRVVKTVHEGEQISQSDIGEIDLPAGSGDFVPAAERSQVVGSYAQADLVAGTVLVDQDMVGDAPLLGDDQVRVGMDLQPGQYPPGVQVGDDVIVALLPGDGDSTTPQYVASGVVREVKSSDTGGSFVAVVIGNKCAEQFLAGASNGDVAIGMVPAQQAAKQSIDCRRGTVNPMG
jgi:anti-sigma factor RsiW